MTSFNQPRYDYRLRVQVPMNSSHALLLRYLKHDGNRVFSHREMVIMAITSYWLAFAYRDAYQFGFVVSDAEMQSVVQDAIHRLNHQVDYLHTFFIGKNMEQIQATNDQKLLPYPTSDLPSSGFQLLPEKPDFPPDRRHH
jgi:hypothetical protein